MQAGAPGGVFVALGSNLDEPERQLRTALQRLDALPGTRVLRCSSFYRTPPWGDPDQPDFLNAVAELASALDPLALLDALLVIESAMGRVRTRRYGPRVIDLDLLLHQDHRVDGERLQLPHPRMQERAFVMLPLAEIAPALQMPDGRRADAVARALDASGIERLADA
jgi:2-amino-4-hydroxy-6-hydroxymethyldihydropteridine diphosphokinase